MTVRPVPLLTGDIFGAVDTFVTNIPCLDLDIYVEWLDGDSAEEIASKASASFADQLDDSPSSKQIVHSYVSDQIRSYHILEKWLHSPVELVDQPIFQLTEAYRTLLLERYYALDRSFTREVLGRKFNHKGRRAFEDESQKTGVKINSCYRQHENTRRVYKSVTASAASSDTTLKTIQDLFLLPELLARDYACVIFMSTFRFDLNTRRLQDNTFDEFVYCTGEIMKGWTHRAQTVSQLASAEPATSSEGLSDLHVDKDFFHSLKEFRFFLERETAENFRRVIMKNILSRYSATIGQDLIRDSARHMILLALNIHHSKQFRLIFVDITEKLCGPWKNASWSPDTAASYLHAFLISAEELNEFKRFYWNGLPFRSLDFDSAYTYILKEKKKLYQNLPNCSFLAAPSGVTSAPIAHVNFQCDENDTSHTLFESQEEGLQNWYNVQLYCLAGTQGRDVNIFLKSAGHPLLLKFLAAVCPF